ncbi:TIGR03621 family F420-dependent LLM class oxidoreductase [Pseudonocardia yunnanensis]|uniref:TIGR03621 family F420-dependent LLM class oxidoreductase n=1 Tax=Pseudonocardia yunnanensis TaxID=58107 RepID=A0ABW4F1N6_9PSEU
MPRPFRFGVTMLADSGSRTVWQDKARQVEDLDYDVLLLPDHLSMPAPFPALLSAAEVTALRVGTSVLNAGFYRPALLARDVAEADQLTEGRLELGLGAGYAEAEFVAAGLPFPSAGKRLEHLADTVGELRRMFASGSPAVYQQPGPPLMLAGDGDRMLRLAATEADVVGFAGWSLAKPGVDPQKALAERVEFVRVAAGERFGRLELNLLVPAVSVSGELDLSVVRRTAPDLDDEHILRMPSVLYGSAQQIAETLHGYRQELGLTYFTVLDLHMTEFAKVIKQLR